MRTPRTFRQHLARAAIVPGLIFAATLCGVGGHTLMTHGDPYAGTVPFDLGTDARALQGSAPTWTKALAADYPDCVDVATKPADLIPADAIVVKLDGSVTRLAFGDAWTRATNDTKADDIWTVGVCERG